MLTVMIGDLVVTFVVLMLAQGVRCLAISHASFIASSAAMPHFSSTELSLMDRLQKQGSDPGPIFKAVNAARHRQRAPLASSSAVYRYLASETYDRDAEEARGRTSNFGAEEMAVYDRVRKRLQKESGNEWAVTWEDVAEEGQMELRKRKLLKRSEDGLAAETLRKRARDELGVGRRPAPQHVTRTDEDEKRRLSQAKVWVKKASTFWGEDVAFIDNKKFVMARTPLQRKRMRAARIVNHLRKASERNDPIYIVPKRSHSFTGIPSVEITAAVARDRIVMWRQAKSWNGAEAAAMYKDLASALRRVWGDRRQYRVVEDGDTKGYQSNIGKSAKQEHHIQSWKLPPRSPEWMPLDYSIWAEIERRMLDADVKGTETKAQYLARLRKTALGLPKPLVRKVVLQMKERIQATVASKGKHIAMD